jgi:hypothetical protein
MTRDPALARTGPEHAAACHFPGRPVAADAMAAAEPA